MLDDHPGLRIYKDYQLTVKRIVAVNAEEQLEWFKLVNKDVMAIDFSLMPGIPVRDILILPSTFSGADVIGVATPPEAGPATEAGNKTIGAPAGASIINPPPAHDESAFSYAYTTRTRSAKKARIATESAPAPRLFVQLGSALLYSGTGPPTKVEDQMRKCTTQFAAGTGGAAGKEYAELERALLEEGQIAHLPILSELPTSNYKYSEEQKLKYVRMRSEEVVSWGLFSADLMNQIKQLK
jgi:hypothetical protein